MPDFDMFITIALAIVALQVLAAIIGPGALKFISTLAILAAAGLAGYAFYLSRLALGPGEAQDSIDHAIQFGALAIALLIAYLIIRSLFRAMARASAA